METKPGERNLIIGSGQLEVVIKVSETPHIITQVTLIHKSNSKIHYYNNKALKIAQISVKKEAVFLRWLQYMDFYMNKKWGQ